MKNTLKTIVVATLAVLAVAASAGAQGPGAAGQEKAQHGPGGGHGMQQMIQKLNLSPAQQNKFSALQKKYQPKMEAMRKSMEGSTDKKAGFEKMRPLMDSFHKEFRAILNADQQKTFDKMQAERKARMKDHMGGKPGAGKRPAN